MRTQSVASDGAGSFVLPSRTDAPGITPGRLEELRDLLDQGAETRFYWWTEWRGSEGTEGVREKVLLMDHYECQRCRERGRYRRADIVHHVKHLRDRPDLALSIWDPETGERQLISVCKTCHEEEHPEALTSQWQPAAPPLTPERWD